MKTYQEYVPTQIPWLRHIPKHWTRARMKHGLANIIGGGTPDTYNPDYWSDGIGIPWVAISDISNQSLLTKTAKFISEAGRQSKGMQIIPSGTLLISIFASLGKTTLLGIDATVNQAILGLIPSAHLERNYLSYVLADAERYISYYSSSNTQENLNLTKIRNLPLLLPPLPEQLVIADFLDRKTAQIDTLIKKKQRQIELLQEHRTALINQAVTKGLNPDAPMKDSGVEWLGEVPAHWKIARIKHISLNMISGPFGSSLTKDMYTKNGFRVYGQEQVIPADFTIGDYYISEQQYFEMKRYAVSPSDVLISCVGTFGKIAVVPNDVEPGIINPRLIKVSPNRNLVAPNYLGEALSSKLTFEQLERVSRGGTMGVINLGLLSEILIPLPPLDEQEEILYFLKNKKTKSKITQRNIDNQISLLNEYRTAIISEAVTGKIDVRKEGG